MNTTITKSIEWNKMTPAEIEFNHKIFLTDYIVDGDKKELQQIIVDMNFVSPPQPLIHINEDI